MSSVLEFLSIKHKIIKTLPDGNCFYYCISKSFELKDTIHAIRLKVAQKLTDEDAILYSAIHNKKKTLQELQHKVVFKNEWADDIEISKIPKIYKDVVIIIIDDNHNSICMVGNRKCSKKIFVRRRNLHYDLIELNNKFSEQIMSLLKNKKCVSINRTSSIVHSNYTVDIFILVLFSSVIVFKLLNSHRTT